MEPTAAAGPHRGGRGALVALLVPALSLVACGITEHDKPVTDPAVLTRFRGVVDPAAGVFRLEPVRADGTLALNSKQQPVWGQVNVVQDGDAGVGPDNSVELVTGWVGDDLADCGRADSFCGGVTLRSFYLTHEVRGAFVELTSMTPTSGHTAFGDTAATQSLDSTYGLWSYGTLDVKGGTNDSATRTWKFDDYDGTAFTFEGRVWGELDLATDTEEICNNGIDDDSDTLTDCDDPECETYPSCAAEQCGNGVDDDGDGAVDCEDADCAGGSSCPPLSRWGTMVWGTDPWYSW